MAYLGVDVGGTKTLVALLDNNGVIQKKEKFLTPSIYKDFMIHLDKVVATFTTGGITGTCVALPGVIDRAHGVGIAFGNLPWKMVAIKSDIENSTSSPVIVENDANLAGLSEAMLVKDKYNKVLYLTISTGIGGGIIINGKIDSYFANSEPGHMILEHDGVRQKWEEFASGRSIVKEYGKKASEITNPAIWRKIAINIAEGLLDLLAILQPDVVIIGGSIGSYFDQFIKPLTEELKKYDNPLVPIPPIQAAARPEEAVIYGCYDLAKATYGRVRSEIKS